MDKYNEGIGKCTLCEAPFIGINAYHIATPWGWFCSDDCIKKYARKHHMTYSDVVQGRVGKAGVRTMSAKAG